MNVLLLVLPIVLPILGGAVLPLFPWKRRQQRNIYVECIVIATSILMWTSLLLHPASYTRLINLAGILEVSVHLDGAGMVLPPLSVRCGHLLRCMRLNICMAKKGKTVSSLFTR